MYLNVFLCNKMTFCVSLRQDYRHQKEVICQIKTFLYGYLPLEAHHQRYWPMLSLPNSSCLRWKQTSVYWTTIGGFLRRNRQSISLCTKHQHMWHKHLHLYIIKYVRQVQQTINTFPIMSSIMLWRKRWCTPWLTRRVVQFFFFYKLKQFCNIMHGFGFRQNVSFVLSFAL